MGKTTDGLNENANSLSDSRWRLWKSRIRVHTKHEMDKTSSLETLYEVHWLTLANV